MHACICVWAQVDPLECEVRVCGLACKLRFSYWRMMRGVWQCVRSLSYSCSSIWRISFEGVRCERSGFKKQIWDKGCVNWAWRSKGCYRGCRGWIVKTRQGEEMGYCGDECSGMC